MKAKFFEANAGTGKTYALTEHIITAVTAGKVSLSEVCAITFTEKAASEVYDRLRSKLSEARRNLKEIDTCFVGTIHSFCKRILERYGRNIGIPPVIEVDEGDIFESMFEQRWNEYVVRLLSGTEPAPDSDAILKIGIDAAHFICLEVIAKERFDLTRRAKISAGDVASKIAILEPGRTPKIWVNLTKKLLQDVEKNRLLLQILSASNLYHGDLKNGISDLLNCKETAFCNAYGVLSRFVNNFIREYREAGYVRFDDLIILTRNLLRDNRQVREELKQKYKLLLVDELQDTDPVQYEIILFLSEERGSSSGRSLQEFKRNGISLQEGKLFLVGDPKQSIYGFRSADLDAYQTIKEIVRKAGGEIGNLNENYRSCKNIVTFSNLLAEKLFPGAKPSEPKRLSYCEGEGPSDCVQIFELRSDPPQGGKFLRITAEAQWIARKVAQMTQKFSFRDIAILLRKLTHAHIYMDELARAGIPAVAEGEKFFYRTQEVIDLVNLMKWILDPLDEISLAAVLRSPLFGLTDLQLVKFFQNKKDIQKGLEAALDAEKRKDIDDLKKIFAAVADIRKELPAYTPREFVRAILEKIPLLNVAAISYGKNRSSLAALNILKVYRHAQEAEDDANVTCYSFVMNAYQNCKNATELGQEPLADESVNAVRVMSIHKSKGLDFPVVFVPCTDWGDERWRGRKNEIIYDYEKDIIGIMASRQTDANYLELKYLNSRQEDDEENRVIYVACTRASRKLIISCVQSEPYWDDKNSYNPFNVIKGVDPQTFPTVTENVSISFEAESRESSTSYESVADVVKEWRKVDAAKSRNSLPIISSITKESKQDAGESFRVRYDPSKADPGLVGTMCHVVLSRIDFNNPDNWMEILESDKLNYATGFTTGQIEKSVEACKDILERFFASSQPFRWLQQVEIIAREHDVIFMRDGKILTGRIDLIAKEGRDYYVIDYKTDWSLPPASLAKYGAQLSNYCEVLAPVCGTMPRPRLILLRECQIVDLSPPAIA